MTESRIEGPYGNAGTSIYHEDDHSWHFTRDLGSRSYGYQVVDQPSDESKDEHTPKLDTQDQVAALIQVVPGLEHATLPLSSMLKVSEAVQKAAYQPSALPGPLLCSGRLYDQPRSSYVDILAHVFGPAGSDVSVSPLQEQRQGWKPSRQAWLRVPVPEVHVVIWQGPGSPIQQICFSGSLESSKASQRLAVRWLDRVLVFRLLMEDSAITAQPIHSVDRSSTDWSYMLFNMWYPQQYALLSQGGFDVYEIVHRTPTLLSSYSSATTSQQQTFQDGWNKAVWVSSAATLAVASRTELRLFSINEKISTLKTIDLPLVGPECWIVDVVMIQKLPNFLLVLTENHLFVLEITVDLGTASAEQTFAIRHYLGTSDFSLRLHIIHDLRGISVLLHSAAKATCLCYHFVELGSAERVLSGPTLFTSENSALASQHWQLLQANLVHRSGRGVAGAAYQAWHDNVVAIFQVIGLSNDFRLEQTLVAMTSGQQLQKLPPPNWRASLRVHAGKTVDEPFIDDTEDTQVEQGRPRSKFMQALQHSRTELPLRSWSFDAGMVIQCLHTWLQESTQHNSNSQLEHIAQTVRQGHGLNADTLLEVLNGIVAMPDIDVLDHALSTMVTDLSEDASQDETHAVVLNLPQLAISAAPVSTQLAPLHAMIVKDYITPLSVDVEGRTRLAKERLARVVAAEVVFASHITRPVNEAAEVSQEFDESQMTLAVRSSYKPSSFSQSAMPLTPSATPSEITQSSRYGPQTYHLPNIMTFVKPLPISLSRSTQRILQHWEVGADPSAYNWQANSKRIAKQVEIEEAESQMTVKERQKLQKKAARHLARERREAAASQQLQEMSSQLPQLVVGGGSQPRLSRTTYPATQPLPMTSSQSQPVTASQAVAGRFGGRPAKKKRKQGF